MSTLARFSVGLCALLITLPLWSAAPLLEKTDVFVSDTGGYKIYRIPGIVVTRAGTLLAYCEGRQTGSSDWGSIDLLLRRSTDGGRTWEPQRRIGEVRGKVTRNPVSPVTAPDQITYSNPLAIPDRNGAVHFLFCLEYMRAFYMRSDDDGRTFSEPVEITAAFDRYRPEYPWQVLATGPGHGIQLRNGRLLVPVWLSSNDGTNGVCSVIYSDNHGRTWHRGDIAIPENDEYGSPSEHEAVQLADGRVMLNARTDARPHRRLVTWSRDGATGWSKAMFQEQLLEPICMASVVRVSGRTLLFSNPDNLKRADGTAAPRKPRDRRNLTVKLSTDDGTTWPVARTLEPGRTGYSDLAVGRHGSLYCFYERRGALTVARFNLDWVKTGVK
jgi:sialidase-1